MGCDSLARAPLPGSRETWEEVPTLSSQVHPYSTFLTDKGCAPARPALRVCKPFQPFMLMPPFLCFFTFYGRATPDARERIPGSASLPRHTRVRRPTPVP